MVVAAVDLPLGTTVAADQLSTVTRPMTDAEDTYGAAAQLDGHVSLALRSPADYGAGEVTTSGITLQQLVDTYGVLPPAPITAR